jgi:transposase
MFQDLKLLSERRDQLVRARTQLINRTHKNLVVSHPGHEQRIPKLTTKKSLQTAIVMLRNDRSVRADLIRRLRTPERPALQEAGRRPGGRGRRDRLRGTDRSVAHPSSTQVSSTNN